MINELPSEEPALQRLAAVAAIRRDASSGGMRLRRMAAKVTVAELAGTLGTSAPALSQWERGTLVPRADHALDWEAALQRVEGAQDGPSGAAQ